MGVWVFTFDVDFWRYVLKLFFAPCFKNDSFRMIVGQT